MKFFEDRRECWLALLIAVAAAGWSVFPTVWAGWHTPAGMWFAGVSSYFDPWDINAYFAAMQQGVSGSFLFRDPYNPLNRPAPLHFIYILLGHLVRVLPLSIPTAFYSASFILAVVFLLAVYFFARYFLRQKFWSMVCLFLVALGGGFGGLVLFQGQLLPDTAFPDVIVFSTLHLPHFVLDELLFLGILFFSYLALTQQRWRYGLSAAFLGGLLSFIHLYSLFVADVVLGVFFLVFYLREQDERRLRFLLPLAMVSVLAAAYFFKVYYLSGRSGVPLWGSPAANPLTTPSLVNLFLGYGLVAIFALRGLFSLGKERSPEALFLLSWFASHLVILYLPVSWQRIMIKSFFVVLCLLAVRGMQVLNLRRDPFVLAVVLFFTSLTSFSTQYLTIASTPERNPWVYLTEGEFRTLEWLKNNVRGKIVLAPPLLSTIIPANSLNFVYLGYQDVKSDLPRAQAVESFYKNTLPSPKEFLQENRIAYIVFDSRLGSLPVCQDNLLEVYRSDPLLVCQNPFTNP